MGSNSRQRLSSQASSEDAAREAVTLLREAGVQNPSDVLRLGALAMVRRSLDAFAAREDAGTGWLAKVVMNGGPWQELPENRHSPSKLIRMIRGEAA